MKAFTANNSPWDSKVNFVDDNNVLVGYDMAQDCCENANWFISDSCPTENDEIDKPSKELNQPEELVGFNFDPEFRRTFSCSDLDAGSATVFRLVNAETKEEKFLCLYNAHNGYYAHGFNFEVPGLTSESGLL